MRSVSNRVASL